MKNNSLTIRYFNYLREELREKWKLKTYGDSNLTASGLKKVLQLGRASSNLREKSIIESFIANREICDYGILNKCKCIENFYNNKTAKVSDHTLKFIVDFFGIEIKSIEEYKQKNPPVQSFSRQCSDPTLAHKKFIFRLFNLIVRENLDDFSDSLKAHLLKGTILYDLQLIKEFASINKDNKAAIPGIYDLLNDKNESIALRAEFALSFMERGLPKALKNIEKRVNQN